MHIQGPATSTGKNHGPTVPPTSKPETGYERVAEEELANHRLQSAAHAIFIWGFVPVNDSLAQRHHTNGPFKLSEGPLQMYRTLSPIRLK